MIQIYEDIQCIGDPEQLRIHKKSLERESPELCGKRMIKNLEGGVRGGGG